MLKLTQTALNRLKGNTKKLKILRYEKCLKSTLAEKVADEDGPKRKVKTQNNIVAAAFASLQSEIRTPLTDQKISRASSIDELLSVSEGSGVSRRHALKVVSTLSEWSSSGKAKITDFENDVRFIKLCRVLSKSGKINRNAQSRSEDLSTVLNITADDEAARLISNLSVPQMVKVMSTLSVRKRRSVLLLRTLAYNLINSNEKLDLKQSGDLLYSMCLLNFVDNNLLSKICDDITSEIKRDIKKSSVIGSIITSFGLLKYKNCAILDVLSEWILQNHTICRPQDIFSLFITLATLNHLPNNSEQLFKILVPQMSLSEARKPLVWLNFVWSLVVLNRASSDHISGVLSKDFSDKIEESAPFSAAAKVKLLNINAAAESLLEDYRGDLLSPLSEIHNVDIVRTKEHTEVAEAVIDTLRNFIPNDNFLKVNSTTRMGFNIDVECLLDKKCTPLPFSEDNYKRKDVKRVAIMVYDYHDMCIGKVEPIGPNVIALKLLKAQNYLVLNVPYTDFKVTDKLVHRVQYLESRLKAIVK